VRAPPEAAKTTAARLDGASTPRAASHIDASALVRRRTTAPPHRHAPTPQFRPRPP
jgi:hypothetical protein